MITEISARTSGEDQGGYSKVISILIVSSFVLAAGLALLQTDAGARAARADREAQSLAMQAMGLKAGGQAEVGYGWQSAFQTWLLLDDQATLAERAGDQEAASRYRQMRDRVAQLSPLLQAPYFDPNSQRYPDLSAYEVDLYVTRSTVLTEQYAEAARQEDAWDGKGLDYTTQLTLVAVTLSLYGLSTTLPGRIVRSLFVLAGSGIAALAVIWMLIVLVRPMPGLSQPAIQAYAEGVGLAYRGDEESLRQAIDALSRALAAEPDYANALYERGNAYYSLEDYPAAADDYKAAAGAGRDDTNVLWNLGWTYYLLGRYEEAIATDVAGLSLDPELVGVRMNLGLAYLAAGRIEEARAEYQRSVETAARQVREARGAGQAPPASLWYYLDAGGVDLDNLLDAIDGRSNAWTQAPSPETIEDPEAVRSVAQELVVELKNLTAALEYTDQPPSGEVSAVIPRLEFGLERYDEEGNFLDYDLTKSFPQGTDRVLVLFDYSGMQDGLPVLWKVYYNGAEALSLRLLEEEWALGEAGRAEKPISYAYTNFFQFSPGNYSVEMYVNWRLVQRGNFVVRETEGAAPTALTGRSGEVLFRDDFSDAFSGWDRFYDEDYTLDYVDGGYQFYVTKTNWVVWGRPSLSLSDVSIEVEATKRGGPDENNFGIICRLVDDSHFYLLQITADGYYGIYKFVTDEWELLSGSQLRFSDAIATRNATNRLRADCVGDQLSLYVNDRLLAQVRDADFASGDVGLLAGTYDEPGSLVMFDNFVVRQP